MNTEIAGARGAPCYVQRAICQYSAITMPRDPPCPPFLRGGETARLRLNKFFVAFVLMVAGCSAPTEAERDNRRLVDAILTAITMKNVTWLDDDAQLAEQRHRDGHLTDDELEELNEVIETARSGDWSAAEKQGYEFRKKHPFVKEGQ